MAGGSRLQDFIARLPKTETHLHLEGALPYALLREADPERWPDDPPFRRPDHRYPSFPVFEKTLLDHALPWFTTAERYYEAASRIFAEHLAQNIRYVETSFHLPVSGLIDVPAQEVVSAIRAAVPPGLVVQIFAGMSRDSHVGPLAAVIDDLPNWDDLAGVDLHGDEAIATEAWVAPLWERVRASGKVTKCHAGEFDGAGRVREALEDLGVLRIQHGVRAAEDAAVLGLAAERGATFDVCPISNVRLGVVPSMAEHPIRILMQAGVRCTISTDDPLCFANTVTDEYQALATHLGFTRRELAQLARNGFAVAIVPSETRSAWIGEVDRVIRADTAA